VDDHPGFRTITRRVLAALGHVVVDTGDAAEAEALFRGGAGFDVVMIDLHLKRADDGVSLVERMAALTLGNLRVLFMSGSDVDAGVKPAWLKAPGRRFLPKPFSLETLQAELDALVADHGAPGDRR
jgi:CheY-like chemotaxis protein